LGIRGKWREVGEDCIMRWVEHVARIRKVRMKTKFWSEKPEGERLFGRNGCR